MPTRSQLTPRSAAMLGVVFIACSLVPILAGLGIIPVHPTSGTPSWVVIGAGLTFMFAGATLLSDAAAGGLGPNGQLLESSPGWVRRFQGVMALAIATALASIASWVAFGSGERHFRVSISLPFLAVGSAGRDTVGRWAFGITAVLAWAVIIGTLVGIARRAVAKSRVRRGG